MFSSICYKYLSKFNKILFLENGGRYYHKTPNRETNLSPNRNHRKGYNPNSFQRFIEALKEDGSH